MSESPAATSSTYISYPSASEQSEYVAGPPSTSSVAPTLLKDRLYVGNLHPTIDEYTLLQIFSKYGKVAKLDFLFHKTGPAKGKPRGYAFIEYSSSEDALKAQAALHDKLLRGRKLVITFAHQAPQTDPSRPSRRPGTDTSRPTTLSLLKGHNKPERTGDKIAALEAKLRQLEQKPDSSTSVTVLPSSLPAKPLMTTMPTISSDAPQRKSGVSSSSTTISGLHLRPGGASSSSSGSLLSKATSSPSTPTTTGLSLSKSSSSSAPSSSLNPKVTKSHPPKASHRQKLSSLGVVIKK
ncbi:hypothetical protein M422DRAFT_23696 [Sphaerobolus stellatus SS14]|uniref:Probable RNA-binding protein 18 n=1 Tax=Sphaerobolus stellatus (strain SS14) TaxID=990650 RepID=A0A0C9UJ25_SPHS4|nr:hypothetical protein M422DRAFT_34945 [Sphaerobolus stellatus SS14]KIJ56426.1 hypothetical protein M422DRAFT_23696 [Sphaerobolus stellatus SS14]